MIDTVLLDMDGVIADWTGSVIRLFDKDPEEVYNNWPEGIFDTSVALGVNSGHMWARINKLGESFWENLEAYDYLDDLFDILPENTYICTKIPCSPVAASGKLKWLQKHARHLKSRFVITTHKHLCANPQTVLIDDHDKNCSLFSLAGGKTILVPQPWNMNASQNNRRFEYIKDELNKFLSEDS